MNNFYSTNPRIKTVDSGDNIFVVGYTYGAFTGSNAGQCDAWFAKYSPSGDEVWLEQIGTSQFDSVLTIAVDSSDSLFVGGRTHYGAFSGYSNAGERDVWFAKYSPSGVQEWLKQFGSSGSEGLEKMTYVHRKRLQLLYHFDCAASWTVRLMRTACIYGMHE